MLGKQSHNNQVWGKFSIDYNTYGDDMKEHDYQDWMVAVLNELHRVITPDGSIFFNHKPRRHNNRAHLPWEFISRSNCSLYQLIIWNRRNSPNIRKDVLLPCTEHIYWLCKDKPVTFRDALDKRFLTEVWEIQPQRQQEHPAPFPQQLVENCILLSTQQGDTVLDPFLGSGTTAVVAQQHNREWVGYEIDETYINITNERINTPSLVQFM